MCYIQAQLIICKAYFNEEFWNIIFFVENYLRCHDYFDFCYAIVEIKYSLILLVCHFICYVSVFCNQLNYPYCQLRKIWRHINWCKYVIEMIKLVLLILFLLTWKIVWNFESIVKGLEFEKVQKQWDFLRRFITKGLKISFLFLGIIWIGMQSFSLWISLKRGMFMC